MSCRNRGYFSSLVASITVLGPALGGDLPAISLPAVLTGFSVFPSSSIRALSFPNNYGAQHLAKRTFQQANWTSQLIRFFSLVDMKDLFAFNHHVSSFPLFLFTWRKYKIAVLHNCTP